MFPWSQCNPSILVCPPLKPEVVNSREKKVRRKRWKAICVWLWVYWRTTRKVAKYENVVSNWLENYGEKVSGRWRCMKNKITIFSASLFGRGAKFNFTKHPPQVAPAPLHSSTETFSHWLLSRSQANIPCFDVRMKRKRGRKWRGNWSGKISLAISPLKVLNLIFHVYRFSKLFSP